MKKKLVSILMIVMLATTVFGCKKADNDQKPTDQSEASGSEESSESGDLIWDAEEEYDEYQEQFAIFVKEQYKKSIEDSYQILQQYYLNPEAAGFDMENVEISFGLASDKETMNEDRSYYKSLYTAFRGFDRNKLTRRQQDEYDSLEWELKSVLEMTDEKFDYYPQLFAPPQSLDANIVSVMSTWEIRSEREAQELATLIDSLPAYVDSCIEYAKTQQEMNLLITNFKVVKDGAQEVLDKGMDTFVLTNLLRQVDELEGVSEENKTKYKDDITQAFERSYIPCFEKIVKAMDEMKDGNNLTGGMSSLPYGKEYYTAKLNYTLGSYGLSCEEIKKTLEDRVSHHIVALRKLATLDSEAVDLFYNDSPSSGYSGYKEILEDVSVKMLADFPEVKNLKYNIEDADPEEKLSEKHIGAYFMVPPIDGDHVQQMRINPDNSEIESIETYTTVAHEGFPGHMYQFAYMDDIVYSDYIRTLEVDAMVEGYAVYAQYEALNYLDLSSEGLKSLYALNDKLGYLVQCIADIGINYEGWDIDETLDYFISEGYSLEKSDAIELYDYLRCTPCSYFPYGLGYEYIAMLREEAEDQLGDKFDVKQFNKAILQASPTPRKVVARYVEEYIESAK